MKKALLVFVLVGLLALMTLTVVSASSSFDGRTTPNEPPTRTPRPTVILATRTPVVPTNTPLPTMPTAVPTVLPQTPTPIH